MIGDYWWTGSSSNAKQIGPPGVAEAFFVLLNFALATVTEAKKYQQDLCSRPRKHQGESLLQGLKTLLGHAALDEVMQDNLKYWRASLGKLCSNCLMLERTLEHAFHTLSDVNSDAH